MDVAALFLHNMRTGVCPAWHIEGGMSEEQATIEAALRRHMAYEQDAGFNEWRISEASPGDFMAKRFTWNMGAFFGTAEHIAAKLDEYYKPYEERAAARQEARP